MLKLLLHFYNRYLITVFCRKLLTMNKKSVQLSTEHVLEDFYDNLLNGNLDKLHIPHSDVFYVKQMVDAHYGKSFTLQHVEDAMRAEGWVEKSYSNPDYRK